MPSKPLPAPGIYVPVPTFFDPLASYAHTPPLDLPAQCAHAVHLARAGITGILLLGSSGEAVALRNDERTRVLTAVRQALDHEGFKQYPLMAGTASYNIEETIQQCVDAKKAGADYAMCLAPGFFANQTTDEGMARWYEAVADGSPLPVLVYNYPAVTNALVLPPAVYTRLAAHANIVGAKLSHADIPLLGRICNGSTPAAHPAAFRVFTGLGQKLTEVLDAGGAGAIDGLAGIFPHVLVRLYAIWHQIADKGADEGAHLRPAMEELREDVVRGEALIVKWGTVGIKEAVARELHIGVADATRLPLHGGMPEGAWAEFEEAFAKLRRVEKLLGEHRANVEGKE